MFRSDCFGELGLGELFLYHGQTYKKESEAFAQLLKWPCGETLDEYVSHYFEPQIVVIPIESSSGTYDGKHSDRNLVHV